MTQIHTKIHKGSCNCGKVTFKFEGDPKWVANCHCGDCRHATGAAYSTYIGVLKPMIKWGTGKPSSYASSEGVRRTFCDRCGTPIAYEGIRWPDEVHFFVGLMEHPDDFVPTSEVHVGDKLGWVLLPKS
ncbi:MAG: GFA family protein [Alphaproteobacteria bacterium]|nr:MAG: GFA family protein [Alphaproteobacteria bacterium]